MASIKVGLDTSAIDALAKLSCLAVECKHNTNNNGQNGESGHCNYKNVSLGDFGKCTMYEGRTMEE